MLRALSLEVPGLVLRPQVELWGDGFLGRPDLVDRRLGIVVEADSFAWHGCREQLAADARRYKRLVVAGWMVLRFTWEDVMFHQDAVREVLAGAVRTAEAMSQGTRRGARAAWGAGRPG